MERGEKVMTNSVGIPCPDMTHSLNVNGMPLASDVFLMEKQQTFNRSKICERMVHPCGAGAYGYFEVTKDVSHLTKAKFLSEVGKRTPIFIRFSTVTYGREFPDSARNPRGFAVKFYTEEGNYDLVGLNFPIFFVRDPALGPDVIRSQQRNPKNFLLNFDALFDFMSLVPESLHCGTMFFSDRGTPYGFRFMHGYGCHTFKWVNDEGREVYVKYHFVSDQGIKNFSWDEAVRMCGEDPDFSKRDLYEHIENGGKATWTAYVQVMPAEEAESYKYDPFDVTKVWSHKDYPLKEFGRLVVDRNPDNYHAEVEQAAFSPGSLVPGIEPSPDTLLQFRMFFYRDTQYYRLGVNLHQIPVNCPLRVFAAQSKGMGQGVCPFARDGTLRSDENGGDEPAIYPNSKPDAPKPQPKKYDWKPMKATGMISRKSRYEKHERNPDEDLEPARELFLRVMSDTDREHTCYNIAVTLKWAKPDIQKRMLLMLYKIHPSYAMGVIKNMKKGWSFEEIEREAKNMPTPALVDTSDAYKLKKSF